MSRLTVVPFAPALREHFYRLNAQWLQKFFRIEPIDEIVLNQPEEHILAKGGAIFFACQAGEVIGTCALRKEAPGVYELTKMGVDEAHHGHGAGRALLAEAIAEFHRREGTTLFLESNSRLERALQMYERAGFVRQPAIREGSHYERADVYYVYRP